MHVTFMLSYFPNLSTKSLLHCGRTRLVIVIIIIIIIIIIIKRYFIGSTLLKHMHVSVTINY